MKSLKEHDTWLQKAQVWVPSLLLAKCTYRKAHFTSLGFGVPHCKVGTGLLWKIFKLDVGNIEKLDSCVKSKRISWSARLQESCPALASRHSLPHLKCSLTTHWMSHRCTGVCFCSFTTVSFTFFVVGISLRTKCNLCTQQAFDRY